MQKRTSTNAAHKAWNILRLALLWARKGGVLMHKRRLMTHLSNFITAIRHTESEPRGAPYYGHRQLSFGNSPIIHVKMHRPNSMRFMLPCINPEVDFDFRDESKAEVAYLNNDVARKSFLNNVDQCDQEENFNDGSHEVCDQDEGIDLKAEEFIAKFYQQLKLQRQFSYIQYN